MRKRLAIGTMGFMVLLASVIVIRAQDAPPPNQGEARQHDGPRGWSNNGPREFGHEGGEGFRGHEGPGFGGGERGGMHGFGGGEHLLRMAENPRVKMFLGLSDEQVERLHKIGIDSEKASVQNRADMELKHIELRELLRSDNPDRDAIMSKIDEANALRGKIEKQHIETYLNARGVLTPDQLKKVKEFMQHGPGGMEHRGEMGHRGMGRPPMHGGPGGPGGPPPAKPGAPPAQ